MVKIAKFFQTYMLLIQTVKLAEWHGYSSIQALVAYCLFQFCSDIGH